MGTAKCAKAAKNVRFFAAFVAFGVKNGRYCADGSPTRPTNRMDPELRSRMAKMNGRS
jgi:hypothetical protein